MSEGHQTPAPTGAQIDHILRAMADSFGQQLRSPVLHSPADQDLDYWDVTFPALDGAGSLAYARSRHDTRDMTIGLFSRCLGCSSAPSSSRHRNSTRPSSAATCVTPMGT